MTYYAHTRGTDKAGWQTVYSHLAGTAELARSLGADTGLAEFAGAAAMFHDLGKYSHEFQRRLEGSTLKVDHATAGAVEIDRLLASRGLDLIGRMLAYCIAGHHGGLPDGGSPADTEEEATLAGRMKRLLKDYSAYTAEIDPADIHIPNRFPAHFRPIPNASGFSAAFATRMIYSILVDADYLETETFCNGGEKPRGRYESIPSLAEQFSRYLQRFGTPTRPIDQRRSAALQRCIQQAELPPGLFSLTLPTGAGKTLTSMAFAMQHAIRHGLKRIIYVIPYTSIIEQNAAVFKNSLPGFEDHILEHHSNFEWNPASEENHAGQPDSALAKLKWAAENWDVPIVVTTNVQFFESLFANRNSRSRKLHNLAKSVILFDEAQMLPREYMQPCMYSVVELMRNYGASAVFCTATQPALEHFLPKGVQIRELIDDPAAEYAFYRRARVKQAGELTDEQLLDRLNSHSQVLCIVNTRKHARALFEGLEGEGCYHLSTLMCPVHRRTVISEIRDRLARDLPCKVVSTQLLEAGVDLDFPVGYRAMAGLESIIQSLGRINRENRRPTGDLFVFESDSEYARYMPAYLKQTTEIARLILKQFSGTDPASIDAIRAYFNLLYTLKDPAGFDSKKILACFEKAGRLPVFDFATAAENFKLIENDTVPVIVPYDPGVVFPLLDELQNTQTPLRTVRKLQPYTVNIYRPEYDALVNRGAITPYAEIYAVLNEACGKYNPHTGLELASRDGGHAIFLDQ